MKKYLLLISSVFFSTLSIGQVINTYPYNQNFESFANGTILTSGWNNALSDNGDWIVDVNGTTSSNTGPTANGGADHNPGVSGGKYLYLESSPPANLGDFIYLESPWFDLTGLTNPQLSFWYHMFGASMGTMEVGVRTGLNVSWNNIISPFTDNLDIWQCNSTNLAVFTAEDSIQFRWHGVIGVSVTSDMAIDDVTIYGSASKIITQVACDSFVSPSGNHTFYTSGTHLDTLFIPNSCLLDTIYTINLTINPSDDASFSYSAASYNTIDTDPTPTITGLAGGSFSSIPAGLSLINTTGVIDVSASSPGAYIVTYTTTGSCPSSSNVSVTIKVAPTPCSELFFSEYIEGSSSNKAFEIYNPTQSPIDLTDYVIYRNNNGSLTPTDSLFPLGLVAPGDVFVVGNPSANFGIMAQVDTTHTMCFYNGDDALWLKKISTGDTIDKIGDIGVDPGSGWPVGAGATNNFTLIRMITVQKGLTNWNLGQTQWDVFPIDMDDSLGMHNMTACVGGPCTNPNIVLATSSVSSNCGFSDGQASVSITSGGVGPFTYSWSSSGATTSTASGLPSGVYTVTVADANTCTQQASAFVNDIAAPIVSIISSTDVTCYNGTDGVATASTVGGIGPFTYLWTPSGETTPTSTNLSAGQNSVVVMGANGCAGANGTVINEPLEATSSINVIGCVSYTTPSGSQTLTTSGVYMDTVTTAAGCDSIITINLTINPLDDASFNYSATNFCPTDPDPSATIIGLVGGTFTSLSGGLILNSGTGVIDLSASTPGTYTVTYTTSGSCPNSSSVIVTINALDDASFTYSATNFCPTDPDPLATITGLAGGTFTSLSGGLILNNGTGVIDLSASTPGTYTVTYATSGSCSNTSDVIVVIISAGSATAVCQNVTVFLDGAGNAAITPADIDGGSSANCGTLSLNASQTSFTCSNLGANNVTLTASDGLGNSDNCAAVVTVVDAILPSAVCQNITVFLDGSGNAAITGADIDGGSADNCGAVNLSASQTAFTCADLGSNNVTLTVTDGSSNANSCVAVVTVVDTISPTIVCQNITVFLNGAGNATIVPSDINNGSSDNCGSLSLNASQTTFTCANIGTNSVTLTGNDGNGNTSSCTAIVTVSDTVSPTAVCQNISVFLDGSGNASILAADIDGGSSDNCSSVSLSASQTAFTCADIGPNSVTLTLDDGNGNISTCVAVVTVIDTISPTAICQNIFVFLDGSGNANILAAEIDGGSSDNCGSISMNASQTVFTCSDLGVNNVSLTVSDGSGNTSTCLTVVTVLDTNVPPVVCPANIGQNIDAGLCGAIVTYIAPTGVGVCPGFVTTQTTGLPSGSIFPVGTTTNTFLVTYVSGSTSSCSFDVVITDNEIPIISCQANIAQNNDAGICGATVTYTAPVGIDNCPGSTTAQTTGLASGSVFPIGITTNTFVVTDASGNMASCSFNVDITDSELPTISCQANIAQNNDVGVCGATINYTAPVSSDNCSGSTTIQTAGLTSGSIFPIGTTTNTFQVTDASGNMASCSFDVIITDSELPTVTCQTNIAQNNDAGVCGASVTYTAPVGLDNCPGSTTAQTAGLTSGSVFPIGTTTNTFEVTDVSGNIASCSFDVVITDSELPTITCQADITQNNDVGVCGASIIYTAPVGLDNCPGSITAQTAGLASGSVFPIGTTTNTFEVTDASGNVASCSFDVVITDSELPTITCQADIAQNNDVGICGATITYTAPVGLDNCPSNTTQTAGLASGSIFPIGTTTNTFEVTDASGNVASCSFDVVITDSELPTIACQADITQNNDVGVCGATIIYTTPVGLDNCPSSTTAQTAGLTSGSVFPIGTTTNTFEVTDVSGNIASCSFDVVITDSELPTIACQANIAQNNDVGVCGGTIIYTAPVGLDNCPGSTTIQTTGLASGSVFPIGATTNTFEVTDASGNVANCSFDVIITDSELPTITCQANIAQNNDVGVCGATITYTAPIGLDNCPGSTTAQTAGLASGSIFPVGTTSNTFVVTDASGNVASCSFDIIISDTELPTIDCPMDINQDNDIGECGAIVTYTAPVGLDNCPGSITIQIAGLASGVYYPLGITTNSFEVTDAAGNVETCSFDIVISDAELPTIVCSDSFESCDSVLNVADPIAMDNCPNVVFELTSGLTSGSTFPVGVTENLYTATDMSGNQETCIVEIKRFILPTIDAGADLEIDAGKAVIIDAVSTDVAYYEWSPPDGLDMTSILDPQASPMFTTAYNVRVVSDDGCEASDSINIKVNLVIEANNFMSPNDDGKNDTWIVKGNYLLDDCSIRIHSSWGNMVYQSDGYKNDWDGTFKGDKLPAGTYFYVISCGSEDPVTGSITLLR